MTKSLVKVLHIEDEPDIRTIAKVALERIGGLTVESCESGPVGLATIPEFEPDVVLLDAMMPDMDGPEVLQKLCADPATSSIPVVFMTAKVQAHEIEHYKSLGALDVITKPINPATLHQQLKDIWAAFQQD